MSIEKAAREYLDFMTSKKGVSWLDYRAESERLENNLREALEAAEHRVHSDAGDSEASRSISNASAENTSQTETKPAQRG